MRWGGGLGGSDGKREGGTCCLGRRGKKFDSLSQIQSPLQKRAQILRSDIIAMTHAWGRGTSTLPGGKRVGVPSICLWSSGVARPSSRAFRAYICFRRAAPSGGMIASMYATWTGALAIMLKYYRKSQIPCKQKRWLNSMEMHARDEEMGGYLDPEVS
jgi:hypothetical protein